MSKDQLNLASPLHSTEGATCGAGDPPVEEWVGAVGGHGPGVLGHGGRHGVGAAILIHTGGQLVPQSQLLGGGARGHTHEEHNQPHPPCSFRS